MHMGGSRGGGGTDPPPPPLKNHNTIGFPSNTGPDPQKNHKVTKPAFDVGPSYVRQVFRWRADVGPLMVVFGSSLPSSTKKTPLAKLSGSVQDEQTRLSLHREQIYGVRTLSIL